MTREEATRKVRMTPEYHYDGVYSHTETNIYDIIDQIFSDHEAQLKQAYINGSNSTNELIQSLYKQIEQLKDKQ